MGEKRSPLLSLRQMVGAGLLASLTAVLSYVHIPLPFTPVPVTGQTFGVMLAGSLLGPKVGLISMIIYLLLGAVGVPVFAGGSAGLGVLLGPRGGYLLACPVAAYVIGKIGGNDGGKGNLLRLGAANFLGGIGIIYVLGVLQLALVTGMNLEAAFTAGALPFLPGDLFKVTVATVAANRVLTTASTFHVEGLRE